MAFVDHVELDLHMHVVSLLRLATFRLEATLADGLAAGRLLRGDARLAGFGFAVSRGTLAAMSRATFGALATAVST